MERVKGGTQVKQTHTKLPTWQQNINSEINADAKRDHTADEPSVTHIDAQMYVYIRMSMIVSQNRNQRTCRWQTQWFVMLR